jgi:hypothetical protein
MRNQASAEHPAMAGDEWKRDRKMEIGYGQEIFAA